MLAAILYTSGGATLANTSGGEDLEDRAGRIGRLHDSGQRKQGGDERSGDGQTKPGHVERSRRRSHLGFCTRRHAPREAWVERRRFERSKSPCHWVTVVHGVVLSEGGISSRCASSARARDNRLRTASSRRPRILATSPV